METFKNFMLGLEAIVAIVFSIFMMYSMFKVKKGVENMGETAKEMSETLQNSFTTIIQQFGGSKSPMLEQPSIEEQIKRIEDYLSDTDLDPTYRKQLEEELKRLREIPAIHQD